MARWPGGQVPGSKGWPGGQVARWPGGQVARCWAQGWSYLPPQVTIAYSSGQELDPKEMIPVSIAADGGVIQYSSAMTLFRQECSKNI